MLNSNIKDNSNQKSSGDIELIIKAKVVNQAVSRNVDKFPQGYILELYNLSQAKTEAEQITILEENIDIVANLLDNELLVSQQETEIKIKLPFFELTRKITKVKNNK